MSIDPRYSLSIINPWFVNNIVHTGHARAEFSSPPGIIEAPAEVRVDDSGAATVHLTAREIALPEDGGSRSVYAFLHGVDPTRREGPVIIGLFDTNICQNLTVTTGDGVYTSHGRVLYSISVDTRGPDVVDISFRPRAAEFTVRNAGNPYYCVLPLLNLISDFERSAYDGFDAHPLRSRQIPDLPPELSEQERQQAVSMHRLTSPIIGFPYDSEPAFIEPLPEYETASKALLEEGSPYAITAVMVLVIRDEGPQLDSIGSWPPLALLPVLMLAQGRRIGLPWIETRDDRGNLVQRLHVRIRCSRFARWEADARPNLRMATGHLLRCAQSVDHLDDPSLWVAIRNLIESRNNDLFVEDQIVHVCRGIEALAKRASDNEAKKLLDSLLPEHRSAVRQVIRTACEEIERVAQRAAEEGAAKDAETLRVVANKLGSNPPYTERDAHFGRIVVRLLGHHCLSDDQALEHAWPGGLTAWMKTARNCRDTPMHGGYFDLSEGLEHLRTKTEVAYHLTDVLLRSLLKELGYEGDYEPACIGSTTIGSVNRVKEDTPLAQLGYDPSAWV